MSSTSRLGTAAGVGFLGCFGLFWSAMTLGFDVMMVYMTWQQARSSRFAVATGRVLESSVETSSDSDGTSYRPKVKYAFSLKGREFQGEKVRFDMSSSSRKSADETVKSYPAGASVKVYYDPADPGVNLLQPGLDGTPLFVLLFMTPFNVVMFGIWYVAFRMLRPLPPPGVEVIEKDGRTHVRLAPVGPLAAALIAAGAYSFGMIFVLAFGFGIPPPVTVAGTAVFFMFIAAGGVYVYVKAPITAGERDLVIDDAAQALVLPRIHGRTERTGLSLSDVTSVETLANIPTGDDSTKYETQLTWKHNGATMHAKLLDTSNKHEAEVLTEWLQQRLKLSGVKDLESKSAL